jgi:HAMP domain-containing protein
VDSDTAFIAAIAAAALAVCALLATLLLARRLRRLREAQATILGESGRDLVQHVSDLERSLTALSGQVEDGVRSLEARDAALGQRLDGAIAHCGVVRYDAMGEMTGQQSSSVALLNAAGTGVVLSSILLREQARLYAKPVVGGQSEFDLSPEERQALEAAMGGRAA